MISNPIVYVFFYLSLVFAPILLQNRKTFFLGGLFVAVCLIFVDLPDIPEYKEHYELSKSISFIQLFNLYNFEPGYVWLVSTLSNFIPFEAFYIAIITFTISAYFYFYHKRDVKKSYIHASIFLSICLYFISFTLRTTIASLIFVIPLLLVEKAKNNFSNLFIGILILLASSFHLVSLTLIALPLFNRFRDFLSRRFFLTFPAILFLSILIGQIDFLEKVPYINYFFEFKINAYREENISAQSLSLFFLLWIFIIFVSLLNIKFLDSIDRVILASTVFGLFSLNSYEFFQGRFLWFSSFLFAYFLSKLTVSRFKFGKLISFFLILAFPLISFLRFFPATSQ